MSLWSSAWLLDQLPKGIRRIHPPNPNPCSLCRQVQSRNCPMAPSVYTTSRCNGSLQAQLRCAFAALLGFGHQGIDPVLGSYCCSEGWGWLKGN